MSDTEQITPSNEQVPERIYLQTMDDDGEPLGHETTWCKDRVYRHDTVYTRGDLAIENARLRAVIADAWRALGEEHMAADTAHLAHMITRALLVRDKQIEARRQGRDDIPF